LGRCRPRRTPGRERGAEGAGGRVEAENSELKARVAELEAPLAAALKRIADLEARLGTDSRNSSKPPSSDPPNAAARPRRSAFSSADISCRAPCSVTAMTGSRLPLSTGAIAFPGRNFN